MGGLSLGIAIETLVAVLLAVTIGYCVLVNRKLMQLRSDQSELKSIIKDLYAATHQAEQAIAGLRESASLADDSLGHQVERVRALDKQLRVNIGKGEALLAKLAAVPRAEQVARPAPSERPAPAERPRPQPPAGGNSRIQASSIGLGLLNAQHRSKLAGTAQANTSDEAAA